MSSYCFNQYIDALKPSASIALAGKANALAASGREILNLTIGEPNFATPAAVVETAVNAIREGDTHYKPGRGIQPLRERIAQKLREENGIACDAANVLVTPGAKFAIYAAVCTLLNAGDEAIVLDPCWVSYSAMIQAAGGVVKAVECSYDTNHVITLELLESAWTPKTRLLIVNTPNNPTGRMLSEREAADIAAFAKKHRVYVIADEIYEKIVYDGNRHISLGANAEIADLVVTVNGLSKCAAMTGWRIGYLTGTKEIVDKIYMLYQHALTCISGFGQQAAVTAFDCTAELAQLRAAFERRRNRFAETISASPAIRCRKPEGAFYAWANFDYKGMDGYAISDYLLETTGVMGVPGDAYGQGGKTCIRFSLAASDAVIDAAAARIADAMSK